jgi:hypothetical protein
MTYMETVDIGYRWDIYVDVDGSSRLVVFGGGGDTGHMVAGTNHGIVPSGTATRLWTAARGLTAYGYTRLAPLQIEVYPK